MHFQIINFGESYLKADQLHSFKKICILPEPPGGNFASGTVWHAIVFKVPHLGGRGFSFLISKLTDGPI